MDYSYEIRIDVLATEMAVFHTCRLQMGCPVHLHLHLGLESAILPRVLPLRGSFTKWFCPPKPLPILANCPQDVSSLPWL
jgi:hypothetical protein